MHSHTWSTRARTSQESRQTGIGYYSAEFVFGVVLALVGASLQALGLCLWKLDSKLRVNSQVLQMEPGENKSILSEATSKDTAGQEQRQSRCQQHMHTYSCVWIVGFGIFFVGNVCDFVALGIAPLSMVALLGSWSLVVNPLAAHFVLQEVVTRFDIMSVVLIVAGIVVIVLGTDHTPNDWTLARLVHHYREPKVVALLVCLSCFIFASCAIITVDGRARAHICEKTDTKLRGPGKYIRLLYVVVGSAVGNFSALFGKAFSGLLFVSISGNDQFSDDPFVVVILLVFAASLPLQIYLINKSLAVNDILFHAPNFFVFWYIGNIATGAVFYDETADFDSWNWAFFCAGISVLFLGVLGTNFAATYKRDYIQPEKGVALKQYHNIKDTDPIDVSCITNDNHNHNIVHDITLTTSSHPVMATDEKHDDTARL